MNEKGEGEESGFHSREGFINEHHSLQSNSELNSFLYRLSRRFLLEPMRYRKVIGRYILLVNTCWSLGQIYPINLCTCVHKHSMWSKLESKWVNWLKLKSGHLQKLLPQYSPPFIQLPLYLFPLLSFPSPLFDPSQLSSGWFDSRWPTLYRPTDWPTHGAISPNMQCIISVAARTLLWQWSLEVEWVLKNMSHESQLQ